MLDVRGLSRVMPCTYCGHDEHVLRCEALIRANDGIDGGALCPCRDVPVPGVSP